MQETEKSSGENLSTQGTLRGLAEYRNKMSKERRRRLQNRLTAVTKMMIVSYYCNTHSRKKKSLPG